MSGAIRAVLLCSQQRAILIPSGAGDGVIQEQPQAQVHNHTRLHILPDGKDPKKLTASALYPKAPGECIPARPGHFPVTGAPSRKRLRGPEAPGDRHVLGPQSQGT